MAAVLAGTVVVLLIALALVLRGRHTGSQLAEEAMRVLHLGALIVDRRDRIVACNPAGRRMGLARGDQLALNELRELAGQARSAGGPREREVRLLSGWLPREPGAVAARAAPLGSDGHVALIVEDVTEARRVADVRRDFVANVSHELKTPVGALSLLAEALREGCEDPQTVRRFAGRIGDETDRLARLVGELIELSRLEGAAPDATGAFVPVAIEAVVGEAVDRTRLAASARRITVRAGIVDGLRVSGNRTQLVTALVNLLDNAIAYSPEGTEVVVAGRRGEAGSEVTVTDQGIGIEESDLDRIFERFYRADPARSRATGGTGLGLAIVKHVAANHGGSVQVRSRPGRGSTFTLTLPPATDAAVPAAQGTP